MKIWIGSARGVRRGSSIRLRLEALEARHMPAGTVLLIGTWNVDIADLGYRPPGFETVLAAMGNEYAYYGYPQAPDMLTVTETRSNSNTGSNNDTEFLTNHMNDAYGAGTYRHGTLNGQGSGGTEGVIFNTNTLQLLQERAVGTVSSSGTIRQELRYLFRPVGYDDGSADFYVYAAHYKAGFTATDRNRRNVEAQQVRANADALGPGVHILYTGDFNADSSNEPAEQTLLAPGNGQAFDPTGRLGQWYNNPGMVDIDTINSDNLNGRLDLLWETGPVIGDYGLQAMPWTYHTFGNDGSVPLHQPADYPYSTALSELDNQADVLYALAHQASDHLPVMQEYQIVAPSRPGTSGEWGVRSGESFVISHWSFAVRAGTPTFDGSGLATEIQAQSLVVIANDPGRMTNDQGPMTSGFVLAGNGKFEGLNKFLAGSETLLGVLGEGFPDHLLFGFHEGDQVGGTL